MATESIVDSASWESNHSEAEIVSAAVESNHSESEIDSAEWDMIVRAIRSKLISDAV